ncbi:MAG: MBL fold metallo-hydrolase [Ilumatobacter sp.]|nr:MAG: MBL fold metallo-hydrolase [Ilumatobacter sp.]
MPTRVRNHNGYLLRWDDHTILFDPGEGTQRQFAFVDASPASINRICLTHFHGDHCLGLPGMLLRLSQDGVQHPVHLHYPSTGQVYLDRLRHASIGHDTIDLRTRPLDPSEVEHRTVVDVDGDLTLSAAALRHRVDAIGWRIEESAGRRMLPDRLEAAGIRGPDIGRLRDLGRIDVDGRTVTLEEMSEHRPGQVFAFIMDTALCDAALELAEGADLVVCESTFLDADAEMAERYGHMTARQAGRLAAEAGARRLVLTHFSQRYPDDQVFGHEASLEFDDVVVAHDLAHIPVPARL